MYANDKSIVLPSGEVVFGSETIIPDGNFQWKEATHNLTRIPKNISIEGNIYKAAHEIEKVRKILGNEPIIIESWLRDWAANSKIPGAASSSRHLFGDGIDFRCLHLSPKQIYVALEKWHLKGGLAVYKSHVHIDWRGVKARW